MADIAIPKTTQNENMTAHRKPSRLQRRAPASLQISRAADWNVAIPLLSPLVSPSSSSSSSSSPDHHRTVQIASRPEDQRRHAADSEKPPVIKKWQHPAAPFYYEPAPPVRPFVPV